MKTIVIYPSKTGYTKKYAGWIAEALHADIFQNSRFPFEKLADYDTIIYGGSLFASGILGVNRLKKALNRLQGKKVIVFGVGLAPMEAETIEKLRNHNFTAEEMEKIRFFYFRGGFNLGGLPLPDQLMMKLMKRIIERKQRKGETLNSDEADMLEVFNKVTDFTDIHYIDELVSFAQNNGE